jgi:broad specificity phosphatase PhoE
LLKQELAAKLDESPGSSPVHVEARQSFDLSATHLNILVYRSNPGNVKIPAIGHPEQCRACARKAQRSTQMQQVYLVRHGETEWSLTGQHTGITDIPLTENGRKVAKLLAPVLARETLALVLTSPLRRARETCELSGLGAVAQIDRDLIEWKYGEFEGLTSREIREKVPEWSLFDHGCPGGETPEQVGDRADRIIARARGAEGNIALFAHGHLLRVLAARWLGFSAGAGRHFLLDTGTLNILSYYYGAPAIKTWNRAIQ